MDQALGLRARKRQRTHRALEDAALRLFAEAGFEATTVEQIAAEADVSPRTFFHHFASKEDVVHGDYEARLSRLTEGLGDRPPHESAATAVRNALLEVAADYTAEWERLLLRARLTAGNPSVLARSLALQHQWEEVVAGAVADRLQVDVAADPRPRLLAAATLSAMRVAQRRWLETGGATPLPTLLVEHLDLLERGLRGFDAEDAPAAPTGEAPDVTRPGPAATRADPGDQIADGDHDGKE